MSPLPIYIPVIFVLTTFITIYIFYLASQKNKLLLIVTAGWMLLVSVVAATGFFLETGTLPPRILVLVLFPMLGIVFCFITQYGRKFIDSFDSGRLTFLHTIRIPIEMVLLWLFMYKFMPRLMTFEGRNFDIISGLTAPLIYYLGFVRRKLSANSLIVWNFLCLAILLFTVSNAILSAPTPFQKFAFDQPTVAVLYFPFVWLTAVVVPIVIFSHLISIRLLVKQVKRRKIPAAIAF